MKTINLNKATDYEYRGNGIKLYHNFMVMAFMPKHTMIYWRADSIEEAKNWLESRKDEIGEFDPDIFKAEIVAINWV